MSATIAVVALISFSTGAEAGFFEDFFGPDPAPQQAAAPAKARGRSSGRKVSTFAPTRRVSSELQFMPSRRERNAEGRAERAPDERRSGHQKVALVDTKQFSAGSKPVEAALCTPEGAEAPTSPTSQLLVDKTLRSGDVLVTDKGVQVFRGQKACPHNATSFVAISSAGMSKSRRSVLLAIEDAMNRPSGYMLAAHSKR